MRQTIKIQMLLTYSSDGVDLHLRCRTVTATLEVPRNHTLRTSGHLDIWHDATVPYRSYIIGHVGKTAGLVRRVALPLSDVMTTCGSFGTASCAPLACAGSINFRSRLAKLGMPCLGYYQISERLSWDTPHYSIQILIHILSS